jgi:DNA-binding IclR family transcriptional regulator
MSTIKAPTQQAVVEALASKPEATAAEVAAAAGLGRSTVAKALATLERAGRVRRSAGGREGGRRLPGRWSLTAARKRSRRAGGGNRLRPGQLDGLVLDYLSKHKRGGPLGPSAVADGLGRSSGAVANCLARLAATGQVRKANERPRRYLIA